MSTCMSFLTVGRSPSCHTAAGLVQGKQCAGREMGLAKSIQRGAQKLLRVRAPVP